MHGGWGVQDAKTGSQIPFPIMLGSVIAAVGYAGMIASYYLAQQQLKDKLKIVQEQHEKFVELHSKLGEDGTCQGVLDSVMAHSNDEASGGAMPVLSILIMFVGCVLLGVFFFQEYNVAMKKKSANKNIVFTLGELVGYRLDYHFSSSKMAKPLLLFAVTFVLILASTIGFALVSGEEIGTAMWRSWTYGTCSIVESSNKSSSPLPGQPRVLLLPFLHPIFLRCILFLVCLPCDYLYIYINRAAMRPVSACATPYASFLRNASFVCMCLPVCVYESTVRV